MPCVLLCSVCDRDGVRVYASPFWLNAAFLVTPTSTHESHVHADFIAGLIKEALQDASVAVGLLVTVPQTSEDPLCAKAHLRQVILGHAWSSAQTSTT